MERNSYISGVEIPPQMFYLWENLKDPCGVKDLHSRFVYANRAYYALNGLPDNYVITGKRNEDIPSPTSAIADLLRSHDRLVINSRQCKTSLEIHKFGRRQECAAYIVDKMPFYNQNGDVTGIWFHAKKASMISTDIFSGKNDKACTVMLCNPNDMFTENEWFVVFLLMRHFSQREIAKILSRSSSRINSVVTDIYNKAGVSNVNHFRDFIRLKGWHTFVPERFARHGHFLLD